MFLLSQVVLHQVILSITHEAQYLGIERERIERRRGNNLSQT